jgi:hypothetical protein
VHAALHIVVHPRYLLYIMYLVQTTLVMPDMAAGNHGWALDTAGEMHAQVPKSGRRRIGGGVIRKRSSRSTQSTTLGASGDSIAGTSGTPAHSAGPHGPQEQTLPPDHEEVEMVMHDDLPTWDYSPRGEYEMGSTSPPVTDQEEDLEEPVHVQDPLSAAAAGLQGQGAAATRVSPSPRKIQARLVPGDGNQIALGRAAPEENNAGTDGQDAPILAVDQPAATSTPAPAEHPIHHLLWPERELGGKLPNEHTLRPAAGIHELADEDDGLLHTELQVKVGRMEDYLSAVGESQADAAGAEVEPNHSADDSADARFVFADVDSDDEQPCDNILGHLAGGLGAPGGPSGYDIEGEELLEDGSGYKEDDSDYKSPEPLDPDRVIHLMRMMRERGGDFEEDSDADSADEGDLPVDAEVGDAENFNVDNKLTQPVWKTDEASECKLKLLQAVHLIAAYKEKHRVTGSAFEELLTLLHAMLPPSCLPRSFYMFRNASKAVLKETLGGTGFQRLHLCSDPECTHLYEDPGLRQCPVCHSPRYKTLENGKEKVVREVRYLGLQQGVRLLLMSRSVSHALSAFDLTGLVDSVHSGYSSRLSDQMCNRFIPGFQNMEPQQRRTAKLRFFETGQVCTDTEWEQYTLDTQAGRRQRTKLLVVEGGCDAFQPFKRRIWSTWMMGYRLTCVNWYDGHASDFEIVTAIAEGATEGKAAHVVAALDAQQLRLLSPPSAHERMHGRAGADAPLTVLVCFHNINDVILNHRPTRYAAGIQDPEEIQGAYMWVTKGGKEVLEKVGVWVICTGIQADAPMRQLLTRSLGCAAARGCDRCGLLAKKGSYNATKYLGCGTLVSAVSAVSVDTSLSATTGYQATREYCNHNTITGIHCSTTSAFTHSFF